MVLNRFFFSKRDLGVNSRETCQPVRIQRVIFVNLDVIMHKRKGQAGATRWEKKPASSPSLHHLLTHLLASTAQKRINDTVNAHICGLRGYWQILLLLLLRVTS